MSSSLLMLSVSSLDHTFSNFITAQHVVSSMQTMGNQSPSNENSHNRPLFLPVSPTDWRQPFFFFLPDSCTPASRLVWLGPV